MKKNTETNISCLLIRTSTCAYQGVGNVSFSENITHVLNDDPYSESTGIRKNMPC